MCVVGLVVSLECHGNLWKHLSFHLDNAMGLCSRVHVFSLDSDDAMGLRK
jgi:hypothetical protein